MNSVLQYVLYVGILVAFSIPLGFYISKVGRRENSRLPRPGSGVAGHLQAPAY